MDVVRLLTEVGAQLNIQTKVNVTLWMSSLHTRKSLCLLPGSTWCLGEGGREEGRGEEGRGGGRGQGK